MSCITPAEQTVLIRRIQEYQQAWELNQRDLAGILGVSRTNLRFWTSGKQKMQAGTAFFINRTLTKAGY